MRQLLFLLCLCVLCGCGKKPKAEDSKDTPGAKGGDASKSPSASNRPALPAGWVEFSHPEGAYTVYLPVKPRPDKLSTSLNKKVPAGQAVASDYLAQTPGLSVGVQVLILPPEMVQQWRAAVGSTATATALGNNRTALTWLGSPAFEDVDEVPGKSCKVFRHTMIGNRQYSCTLIGNGGRPTAAERAAVFDSFTLGK